MFGEESVDMTIKRPAVWLIPAEETGLLLPIFKCCYITKLYSPLLPDILVLQHS
jgi:hypothetical protein